MRLRTSLLLLVATSAPAFAEGEVASNDPRAYPAVVALRPPVFPVGVIQASALLASSAVGDEAGALLGVHAGVRSGIEAGLDTVLPLAPEDAGLRLRGSLERVFYDGAHLEITSELSVEYDFAGQSWSETGFVAELTYQLGGVIARVGGDGLDARLDHTTVACAVPVGVGLQLGASLYVEGSALAIASYDADDGAGTRLAPLALAAIIGASRSIDVIAGVGTGAGLDDASDEERDATAHDSLTLYVGASYRLAL